MSTQIQEHPAPQNVNTDLDLILALLNRDNYTQYYSLVNRDPLCKETIEILNALEVMYRKLDTTLVDVDIPAFYTWFTQAYKTKMSKEDIELYRMIFDSLQNRSKNKLSVDIIIQELNRKAIGQKVIELVHTNKDLDQIKDVIDTHTKNTKLDVTPLEHGIEALADVIDFSKGLHWRNNILNSAIHPLTLGVFGVIAGRPGTGKTSFLAGEVSNMAKQLKDDEVILWFNNENIAKRIKQRIYCATLEKPWSAFIDAIRKGNSAKIDTLYRNSMGGKERIEFFDIHGLSPSAIERIIKKYNPRLIVIDMLDHLVPPKQSLSNAFNGDLYYGALYQWILSISCKYAPVLGTSQIPYLEGEDSNKWPPLDALSQSKTNKQGAVTFQLMIGMWGDSNKRYLSTPKNKYGNGGIGFRCEMEFDEKLSIYRSL